MSKDIKKETIVKYKDGYYRVSAMFKKTANLAGIFNSIIYHKSIPLDEIEYSYDEWLEEWENSETYKSM